MAARVTAGENFAEVVAVNARIAPVGSVNVGAVAARTNAAPASEPPTDAPRSAEAIYEKSCAVCHAAGIAGAPRRGDTSAWAPRIAQGKALLRQHAIDGLSAMPPRGACTDCSDGDIERVVEWMIATDGS